MSKSMLLSFVGFVCFMVSSIALAGVLPEPNQPNLNNDDRVNFADYAIMGQNWQLSGTGLAGDLDDSNTVDINDLAKFCWYWLTEYSEYQQCGPVDLDKDGIISFEDLAKFAQNWLLTGVGLIGDFYTSNSVDCNDLSIFADCWLKGSRPLDIWEQFKAALRAGDVAKALTFMAEVSRDKYTTIFQIIEYRLPEYAAGMGDLILKSGSEIEGEVKYEMTHQVGETTYLFPVIFIQDEHKNWQIYGF